MAGIYLTWLADVLRSAGVKVVEEPNWQYRARSSGGFPVQPLAIQWHHTASSGSNVRGDINYMLYNSAARPVGNIYLARDGTAYILCGGAANTAGKGGPMKFSRGTIPLDSGNTRSVAIEAANNGVGQTWPQVQIDAYFKISNAINKKLGNVPADLYTHNGYAPTRKIDPATSIAVEGPWKPGSVNTSRTWSQNDVRSESSRRAGTTPTPAPTPEPGEPAPEEDDRMLGLIRLDSNPNAIYIVDGISARKVRSDEVDELTSNLTYDTGFRYYDLTVAGRPQIRDINKIPKRTDDQIQLYGIETEESKVQP